MSPLRELAPRKNKRGQPPAGPTPPKAPTPQRIRSDLTDYRSVASSGSGTESEHDDVFGLEVSTEMDDTQQMDEGQITPPDGPQLQDETEGNAPQGHVQGNEALRPENVQAVRTTGPPTGTVQRTSIRNPPTQVNVTYTMAGPRGAHGGGGTQTGPFADPLASIPPLQPIVTGGGGGARGRTESTRSQAGLTADDTQIEEKMTQKETRDRLKVDTGLMKLAGFLGQVDEEGRSTNLQPVRAKLILDECDDLLISCDSQAADRISKEKDARRRDKLTEIWVQWIQQRYAELDSYRKKYAEVDPDYLSPGQAKKLARDNAEQLVQDKLSDIRAYIAHIEQDLRDEAQARRPPPRQKLKLYNDKLDRVVDMVGKQLPELQEQRNAFETNLATKMEAGARQRQVIRDFNITLEELRDKLYSLDWGENTMGDFNPPQHSTQIPGRSAHSSGNLTQTQSFNQSAILKYKHMDPPQFKGDKTKYSAWKKEMQEDVLAELRTPRSD